MTREELRAKGWNEDQINDYLNDMHKLQTDIKKKDADLKTIQERANQVESQLETINKSQMTEAEKLEAMKKEAEADRELAKSELSRAKIISNEAKFKKELSGFDLDDELIISLVSDDEEKTLNNAKLLKNRLEGLKETVAKSTKEELAGLDVKPNPTNIPQEDDESPMTTEKFSKMTMSDQAQWKNSNYEEYSKLFHRE